MDFDLFGPYTQLLLVARVHHSATPAAAIANSEHYNQRRRRGGVHSCRVLCLVFVIACYRHGETHSLIARVYIDEQRVVGVNERESGEEHVINKAFVDLMPIDTYCRTCRRRSPQPAGTPH